MLVILWLLAALGILVLLAALFVLLAVYGYRRLGVEFASPRLSPALKINLASVASTVVGVLTRNFLGAAGSIVDGLKLEGRLVCRNPSLLPLYLPAMRHQVVVAGNPALHEVATPAFWLKPRTWRALPVTVTLATGDVARVALAGLTHQGTIRVEVHSEVRYKTFSYARTTCFTTRLSGFPPRPAPPPPAGPKLLATAKRPA